jgi:hypothetical protein
MSDVLVDGGMAVTNSGTLVKTPPRSRLTVM